jgi:hypothetical protein
METPGQVVKDHPATWGYYICKPSDASTATRRALTGGGSWPVRAGDDCCAGWEYLQELAAVYRMMKAIDPYHLTAGALECGEMHAFQEPQLSLDAPMRENYRPDLTFHGQTCSAYVHRHTADMPIYGCSPYVPPESPPPCMAVQQTTATCVVARTVSCGCHH